MRKSPESNAFVKEVDVEFLLGVKLQDIVELASGHQGNFLCL